MSSRVWPPLAALGVYFGVFLLPEWWPSLSATGGFYLYQLTIPCALIVLAGCAIWSVAGALIARRRGLGLSDRHRTVFAISLAGLVLFGSTILLSRLIRGGLPTGSHVLEFDTAGWRDPTAAEFAQGDISPRQKMLGSLIRQLRPGQTRAELEALLGPSLETAYFRSTGRDLIYVLGLERDSFIRIDFEWLLIWLDEKGGFQRYEIYRD